jgi:tetratricopeptide (TPR) repeat protein/serine/threonine protein kinase
MVVKRLLDGRYQFIRVVSTKSYSKTYLMMDQADPAKAKCIVKHLQLPTQNPITLKFLNDLLDKRVKILQRLEAHGGLEKQLAVIQESQDFYWVRGYVPGQSLQVELAEPRSRPEAEIRKFLVEVLTLLEGIQRHGIVHQNLHPNNLIRQAADGRLVIVDFGLVQEANARHPWPNSPTGGTPADENWAYLPQVNLHQVPHFNADHFALGMMALQLATGLSREALPHLNQADFFSQVQLQLDECSTLSDSMKELLLQMLSSNPGTALPRAKDILTRLACSPDPLGPVPNSAPNLEEAMVTPMGVAGQRRNGSTPVVLAARAPKQPLRLTPEVTDSSVGKPLATRRVIRKVAIAAGIGAALLAAGLFGLKIPQALETSRLTQQAEQAEQSGQIPVAIGYLEQILQQQPDHSPSLVRRSTLLLKNGQTAAALQDLTQAIQVDAGSPALYFQRGNVRFDVGDLQGAIDDYTAALELDSTYGEAYLNRGNARADLGDEGGAVEDYTAALNNTDSQELQAFAYLNRCLSLSNLGDYTAALTDCSTAINLRPSNSLAYENRGLVKRKLEDYQGAIQDFTIAIQINSGNPEPYYNRGLTRQNLGDLGGAMTDFKQTINLNPNHPFAYYDKGMLHAALGEIDAAIADLEKVASACLEVSRIGCFDDAQYQLNQLRSLDSSTP